MVKSDGRLGLPAKSDRERTRERKREREGERESLEFGAPGDWRL